MVKRRTNNSDNFKTIGFVSDVHYNLEMASLAARYFKDKNVDIIIGAGDLMEENKDSNTTVHHGLSIIDTLAQVGVPVHLIPGSHEPVGLYSYMVGLAEARYANVIDALKADTIYTKGQDIVFVGGSDFTSGGEYTMTDDKKTGLYLMSQKGKKVHTEKYTDKKQEAFDKKKTPTALHFIKNQHDLEKKVRDPDKTIVVSHVPRRFAGLQCADMAYFAEKADKSLYPGEYIERLIKQNFGNVSEKQIDMIAKKHGLTLKRENRGNEILKNIYEELGIRKAISGHFHESTHRAHNAKGEKIRQRKPVSELYWNCGYGDIGHFGILTLHGNKVSYQNIKF